MMNFKKCGLRFMSIITFSVLACNSSDEITVKFDDYAEIKGRVIFYQDGQETGVPNATIELSEYGFTSDSEKNGNYVIRIAKKEIKPDINTYGLKLSCNVWNSSLFDDWNTEGDDILPLIIDYSGLSIFPGIRDEYNFYYTSASRFYLKSNLAAISPGESLNLFWNDLNPNGLLGYRIKMTIGSRDEKTLISFIDNNNIEISYEELFELFQVNIFPVEYKLWVELLAGNNRNGSSAALINSDTLSFTLNE